MYFTYLLVLGGRYLAGTRYEGTGSVKDFNRVVEEKPEKHNHDFFYSTRYLVPVDAMIYEIMIEDEHFLQTVLRTNLIVQIVFRWYSTTLVVARTVHRTSIPFTVVTFPFCYTRNVKRIN